MPLGRQITDGVRQLIARVYLEHPDWRAKEIQAEVNARLKNPTWPGLSAVQKELARIRKKQIQSPNPEDKPWSMAVLHDGIPPEALPSVLRAWVYAREHLGALFTIRDAKWVARLCFVIKDIKTLTLSALDYSSTELAVEIVGGSVDAPSPLQDLKLCELLTGEKITPERKLQILREPKYGRERIEELVDDLQSGISKYVKGGGHERTYNQEI